MILGWAHRWLPVAIHKIPEGIAVVIPIPYTTRSRAVAFAFQTLSGLAVMALSLVLFGLWRPNFSSVHALFIELNYAIYRKIALFHFFRLVFS
jgi:zinc transporter ZupT